MKEYRIFVINPGSTSTKLALFSNEKCCLETCVNHDAPELLKFKSINDQLPLRMKDIADFIRENHIDLTGLDAIAARGGGCFPLSGGTYRIDEKLAADTREAKGGLHHPSNSGSRWRRKSRRSTAGDVLRNPLSWTNFRPARISGIDGVYRKAKCMCLT